jgi:hypothetical protein
VQKYNETAKEIGGFSSIAPEMLGVVPTMVTLRSGAPIESNQIYLDQVSNKGYYVFQWLRENSNLYATAPNNGVPVLFAQSNTSALGGVVEELENLSEDFLAKAGV